MCLARNVLGGRNFETYGDDPYHVGKLATALVKGVQSQGIGATPKHYLGESGSHPLSHFSHNIGIQETIQKLIDSMGTGLFQPEH